AWYGPDGEVFVARSQAEAEAQALEHYGHAVPLEQDPDVLDTWFSSGLWPFSTLGWPDDTPDLRRFYPTDVMETGYDILFFWVARMIMMGLLFTNDIPFHTVYLHGLVRDEHGRKMSKTFNNVIDPIEVMDEYGADALRFTLLTGSTPGNDLNLSLDRIRANRNFANKIWNAARFVLGNLPDDFRYTAAPDPATLEVPDRWILHRLYEVVENATRLFEGYQFGEAGRQSYEFLWGDFADWYLEACKPRLRSGQNADAIRQTLVYVLDQTLRLLHPFVPFVTEELWQHLPHPDGEAPALIVAAWPEPNPAHRDPAAAAVFERLREVVRAIRNARTEYRVEPGRPIAAIIAAGQDTDAFVAMTPVLTTLARIDPAQLQFGPLPTGAKGVTLIVGEIGVFLPLAGLVDLEAERARLRKQLAETEARIAANQARLNNPGFAAKAPAHVVEQAQQTLAELEAQAARLREQIAALA
ncbi:MAG: class I tRNA ligase family protein, partial [Caldilineales bacterium]|nr:class I tRNA ligase family protein [Caldilineales bacterium]